LSQEFGAVVDPAEQLEVETAEEVELQSSGAAEFRIPNAAEDFRDIMEAVRAPDPDLVIEPAAPVPAASAPAPSMPPPPPPTPARPSPSVRETRGQSVAAFFQAMLSARPPGSAPSGGTQHDGRAPDTPGPDAVLPPGTSANPTAPLSPAVPAASPQDATVSFDDFFGAPAGGSGGSKGSSDAGEDDLDQFQSWLQNLKR
jgi:hypothetical protein